MIDLRLYAVLDPELAREPLDTLARRVVTGGATLVQLHDKHGSTRRLLEEARAIKKAIVGTGVPLLINDRVDVALAVGADGVHVGQDDMPVKDARRLLGPDATIGLSVKTLAQAETAPLDLLNYVCVGGVFATTSKDSPDPPIGVSRLRAIVNVLNDRAPKLRVGATSGIELANVVSVIEAGVDGVAVMSALSLASDPTEAASAMRDVIDDALVKRGMS